ncbi:hypothetical protein ACJX0J_017232, partial [Zea mays]
AIAQYGSGAYESSMDTAERAAGPRNKREHIISLSMVPVNESRELMENCMFSSYVIGRSNQIKGQGQPLTIWEVCLSVLIFYFFIDLLNISKICTAILSFGFMT